MLHGRSEDNKTYPSSPVLQRIRHVLRNKGCECQPKPKGNARPDPGRLDQPVPVVLKRTSREKQHKKDHAQDIRRRVVDEINEGCQQKQWKRDPVNEVRIPPEGVPVFADLRLRKGIGRHQGTGRNETSQVQRTQTIPVSGALPEQSNAGRSRPISRIMSTGDEPLSNRGGYCQ